MFRRIGWLSALLLVASVPAASAQVTTGYAMSPQQTDTDLTNYFSGYLTWNAGKGGISWTPGAATEDPASRTPDPTWNQRAALGWKLRVETGSDAGLIPVDEFVSAPFPETLYLNVSRTIQANVVIRTLANSYSCSQMAAELYVGETFAGGQAAIDPEYMLAYQWAPAVPDGMCVIPFRLHPEVEKIPAGSIVKLRLLFREGDAPPDYVFKGQYAANLRFPFYPPHELAFRIPELATQAPQNDEPDEKGVPLAGLPAAGLLLVAPFMGRRRARTLLLAAALATAGLAGCIGAKTEPLSSASPTPDGGFATTSYLDDPKLEGNASGMGNIVGLVKDEFNRPIAKAHVSLLGTDRFAVTDASGQFIFENITAGEFKIRIDRESFRSFEGTIVVQPGRIAKIEVTMTAPDRPAGFRPHLHDDWGGASSLVLRSAPVLFKYSYTADRACAGYSGLPLSGYPVASWACRVDFFLQDRPDGGRASILPGAYDVEVTVRWDATQNRVGEVGVGVIPNHDPGYVTGSYQWINDTLYYPKKNGVTTHIRTNWEMQDRGHQVSSSWTFFLYFPTGQGYGGSWSCCDAHNVYQHVASVPTAQVITGPFQVEVKIHKGVVPVEPAHPDFWQGADRLTVLDQSPLAPARYCAPLYAVVPLPCQLPNPNSGWIPTKIVPPGTAALEVTLEQDKAGTPAGQWGLLYKTGATSPRARDDFSQYKALQPTSSSGTTKTYVIPVAASEEDPFYAKRSMWHFALTDNDENNRVFADAPTFKLSAVAVRAAEN